MQEFPMKLPEACLFDMDGLLIDSEPLHGKAWSEAASVLGGHLTDDNLLQLRGRRRLECAQQISQWIGKPTQTEEILKIHHPIAKRILIHAKAMPGAEALVRWCLENDLPIALVTSSTSSSVAYKSSPHPWINMIETRVLGDDPELLKGKPAPDPFLLAARKLNVNPKKCWALEDSESGTKSALQAGCLVWVLQENDYVLNLAQKNPKNINNLIFVLEELKKCHSAGKS